MDIVLLLGEIIDDCKDLIAKRIDHEKMAESTLLSNGWEKAGRFNGYIIWRKGAERILWDERTSLVMSEYHI